MSAPILLSTFLKSLSGRDLPPEVEEHRIRLRRVGGEVGSIDRQLQKWSGQMVAERARLEVAAHLPAASPGAPRDEQQDEAQKAYARGALEMARALEEINHRIIGDAPTLDSYDELVHFFKQRRVYAPDLFPPREFVAQNEHNNEEYKQLLIEAMNLGIERARKNFTPQVRSYNWLIGALAFVAANSFGVSIFLFKDNPLRLSIGFLLCFDTLLAIAYIFFRMSRSKETQLRAHIQRHVDSELVKARAEQARREEERYKQYLEEERERREAFENEQEKKRVAFDRVEAQRLENLQALFSGKAAAQQGVLATLLPLQLPVPCEVSFRILSAHTAELTLHLPEDRILPPELQRGALRNGGGISKEMQELIQQCTTLAASLAIRHAAEIMFNLPTCNTVVINGVRSQGDPEARMTSASQILHAEIDRKNLGPMGRTLSPLLAIKRFKHRFSGTDRGLQRTA